MFPAGVDPSIFEVFEKSNWSEEKATAIRQYLSHLKPHPDQQLLVVLSLLEKFLNVDTDQDFNPKCNFAVILRESFVWNCLKDSSRSNIFGELRMLGASADFLLKCTSTEISYSLLCFLFENLEKISSKETKNDRKEVFKKLVSLLFSTKDPKAYQILAQALKDNVSSLETHFCGILATDFFSSGILNPDDFCSQLSGNQGSQSLELRAQLCSVFAQTIYVSITCPEKTLVFYKLLYLLISQEPDLISTAFRDAIIARRQFLRSKNIASGSSSQTRDIHQHLIFIVCLVPLLDKQKFESPLTQQQFSQIHYYNLLQLTHSKVFYSIKSMQIMKDTVLRRMRQCNCFESQTLCAERFLSFIVRCCSLHISPLDKDQFKEMTREFPKCAVSDVSLWFTWLTASVVYFTMMQKWKLVWTECWQFLFLHILTGRKLVYAWIFYPFQNLRFVASLASLAI